MLKGVEYVVRTGLSELDSRVNSPGVIKSVEDTIVGPGERRWVEAVFSGRAGLDFANEGQTAEEVGVPSDRANGEKSSGCQRHARVQHSL